MTAYLDASAFVKLVKEEAESEGLHAALMAWSDRISSWLLYVEAIRATRILGDDATARACELLADVTLIPIRRATLRRAAQVIPLGLRSLDAIHLATALELGEDLGVLVTYDVRMIAAAKESSIEVLSPN